MSSLCDTCCWANHGCPVYGSSDLSIDHCVEYRPHTAPMENTTVSTDESHDPDHYRGDIEAIDAMRSALGKEGFTAYLRGTIIKYCWRLGRKDQDYKEAKKALQYCQWLYDNLMDKPLSENIT